MNNHFHKSRLRNNWLDVRSAEEDLVVYKQNVSQQFHGIPQEANTLLWWRGRNVAFHKRNIFCTGVLGLVSDVEKNMLKLKESREWQHEWSAVCEKWSCKEKGERIWLFSLEKDWDIMLFESSNIFHSCCKEE